jgi:glycosyl transferase family 25
MLNQIVTATDADWPAFVINLENARERWAAASAQLTRLGIAFERLPAVDGTKLSKEQVSRVYDGDRNRQVSKAPMCPEEIGCYLSHIEAWKHIAARGAAGGFVFEDDFLPFRAWPTLCDR